MALAACGCKKLTEVSVNRETTKGNRPSCAFRSRACLSIRGVAAISITFQFHHISLFISLFFRRNLYHKDDGTSGTCWPASRVHSLGSPSGITQPVGVKSSHRRVGRLMTLLLNHLSFLPPRGVPVLRQGPATSARARRLGTCSSADSFGNTPP